MSSSNNRVNPDSGRLVTGRLQVIQAFLRLDDESAVGAIGLCDVQVVQVHFVDGLEIQFLRFNKEKFTKKVTLTVKYAPPRTFFSDLSV